MKVKCLWNILKQQSKALKCIIDICKIDCIYVPQPYIPQKIYIQSTQQSDILMIKHGKQLQQQLKNIEIRSLIYDFQGLLSHFMINQDPFKLKPSRQQLQKIYKYLRIFDQQKKYLTIDIYKLINLPFQQKIQQLQTTQKLFFIALSILDQKIFKNMSTKYLISDSLSILDILLYFHIINIVFFSKKDYKEYQKIMKWAGRVYKVREVKIMTHQWYSMAKQIKPSINIKKNKAKL